MTTKPEQHRGEVESKMWPMCIIGTQTGTQVDRRTILISTPVIWCTRLDATSDAGTCVGVKTTILDRSSGSVEHHQHTPSEWWQFARRQGVAQLVVVRSVNAFLAAVPPPPEIVGGVKMFTPRPSMRSSAKIRHRTSWRIDLQPARKWTNGIYPDHTHRLLVRAVDGYLTWVDRMGIQSGRLRSTIAGQVRGDFVTRWKRGIVSGPRTMSAWRLACRLRSRPPVMQFPACDQHLGTLFEIDMKSYYPNLMLEPVPCHMHSHLERESLGWVRSVCEPTGKKWIAQLDGRAYADVELADLADDVTLGEVTIYHARPFMAKWARWVIHQKSRFESAEHQSLTKIASVVLHMRLGMSRDVWHTTDDPSYAEMAAAMPGEDVAVTDWRHGDPIVFAVRRNSDGTVERSDPHGFRPSSAPQIGGYVVAMGRARMKELIRAVEESGHRVIMAHTDGMWATGPPDRIPESIAHIPMTIREHSDVTITTVGGRTVAGKLLAAPGVPVRRRGGGRHRMWRPWTPGAKLVADCRVFPDRT